MELGPVRAGALPPVVAAIVGTGQVDHLLRTYGYWAVFVLVGAESIGIPVPGETALIAAGLYAGSTHRLSVAGIVAAAAAGAIVGDNIGYGIGRWGGFRLLRRYGHYVRLDERRLKVGRYLFDRHGGKVVFFGRFVSILRTYAAFLAGTNHMRWRRFVLANAGGGILWATFWGVAAYAFGSALQRLQTPVDIVVGVVAGVGLLTGIAVLRRKGAELTAKAEEAYPGPLTERVRQSPHRGE